MFGKFGAPRQSSLGQSYPVLSLVGVDQIDCFYDSIAIYLYGYLW